MIDLHVGQKVSVQRAFGQCDFDRFAALSGDDNPIHVDPAFAVGTRFGRTVAHGMLLYSAVCGAIHNWLQELAAVQWEQELMFPNPTFCDEQVTIELVVNHVAPAGRLVELGTTVVKADGSLGLQGRALISLAGEYPSVQSAAPEIETGGTAFKGLAVGQQAAARRTFTAQDLIEFAELAGAATFPQGTVPGGLLGGLFSYLLGTRLPGRGTNYLKQRLLFPAPARPGEELTVSVEIIRLRPEKELVNLSTVCTNPAGSVVCRGEALVLAKDVPG